VPPLLRALRNCLAAI